jgi:hypothetical protein
MANPFTGGKYFPSRTINSTKIACLHPLALGSIGQNGDEPALMVRAQDGRRDRT